MKTLKIMSIGLLLTGAMACAQKSETPKEVTVAFAKKFPNAKSVKWNKESDTEWEAEFKIKKIEYSANFETNGTWKETEHEIELSEVPENIKTALKTEFPNYDIEEIELSETSEGKFYEFEIELDETTLEVAFNTSGKLVKKETKNEDEEED